MASPSDETSLITYPCAFPIKVMGAHVEGFVAAVVQVAQRFDPGFDPATVQTRPSRAGNWLGVTITVTATSRAQLDELYRTLSTHPMVRVVL
ncbi:MAG: YbeD family protein [Rubrivivax sp.]